MKQLRAYISTILGLVILAASLLPALHAFDHEKSSEGEYKLTENITKVSVDCDLCDFRITNTESPSIYVYEIFAAQKEMVSSVSLAETVNLFPKPLFSLRAPPVVVS